MKTLLTILFCVLCYNVIAQIDASMFTENKERGFVVYAANKELCPVTLSVDFDLTNMTFSGGQQKVFVVPAKTDKFKLGELDFNNQGKKYGFSYKTAYNLGDVNLKSYDTSYAYDLPFARGKGFRMFQGYNGSFSHQGIYALDFTMPEGTEVVAARDGIVVKVVQNNNTACMRPECNKYNNFISVYHTDGTFAEYVHLKYNGSKVKVGDRVKKGDVIAYSGNTGWSSGPHLHFECSLPGLEKRRTIVTKFRVDNGSRVEYLKENELYVKNY